MKPILFSPEMVRAILDRRKTQTRRIIKPQPYYDEYNLLTWSPKRKKGLQHAKTSDNDLSHISFYCPMGKKGSVLWVKESHYLWGKWVKNGKTKTGKQAWKFQLIGQKVSFEDHDKIDREQKGWHKRPSIFMPKWASRIKLEITDIRVQRLQDISEEDAIAEGIKKHPKEEGYWPYCGSFAEYMDGTPFGHYKKAKDSFKSLWKSINGPDSWDLNAWVWIIEFKKMPI